jgi:hypothetical protein
VAQRRQIGLGMAHLCTVTTWAAPCFARCAKHGHQERWYPSAFSVVPFGFAQGRLWPQKARLGSGTRATYVIDPELKSKPGRTRRPSLHEHRECRDPFGFAQGRLFDSAQGRLFRDLCERVGGTGLDLQTEGLDV